MQRPLPKADLERVLTLTPTFWSHHRHSRLFLTGATGFIGSWLLQTLQHANDTLGTKIDVVALSRDPDHARQRAPHMFCRPDTVLLRGDVLDLSGAIGKVDLCIHAATDVGDPAQAGNPLKVFDTIVRGTGHVIDLARASGASRLLLASSGAVYGPQPVDLLRVAEDYAGAPDPLQPAAAYGNGKRAAEWLACAHAALAAQTGLHLSIARIFALIGPGLPLDGPFAAGNFVADAMAGRPINIKGDGRPLRSYLYTADLCVWLLRILESGMNGHAYNVGSENDISIADLARRIRAATGEESPVKIQAQAQAQTLPPRYVPDTLKARQALNLEEYTSVDSAIAKTIEWTRATAS